jgi:hypothetical protein
VGLLLAAATTAPAGATGLKAMWGPFLRGGKSLFPVYHSLGVRIYEDDLLWNVIARRAPLNSRDPNDPHYRWPTEVSRAIVEAKKYGMQVALQIIGTPRWANGGRRPNWAPRYAGNFSNFATAAARRYPGVHLWMVWGEPMRRKNWQPLTPARPFQLLTARQKVAPHRYAEMLDAAYEVLHAVNPANKVIGGMTDTTGEITPQQWIENMRLPDGRPPRLDMYGHNPFSVRAPRLTNPLSPFQQYDFSDVGRLADLVAKNLGTPANPAPPLFLTEWTIPTAPDREFNYYVDPRLQAVWITDAFRVLTQRPDIFALGWIHLYDVPPDYAGGLIRADGRKKPGYFAWKTG